MGNELRTYLQRTGRGKVIWERTRLKFLPGARRRKAGQSFSPREEKGIWICSPTSDLRSRLAHRDATIFLCATGDTWVRISVTFRTLGSVIHGEKQLLSRVDHVDTSQWFHHD